MAVWLERYRGWLTLVLLVALALGLAVWWQRRPAAPELVVTMPTKQAMERPRTLVVDVGGAVVQPGLYTLNEGARLADALDAAGGPTSDADLARINRAAKVRDEQQIRVPYLATAVASGAQPPSGVPTPAPAQPGPAAPLNINTASLAELETLPGIGPVTAQRIVAFRDEHGPFSQIEQLKEAKLVTAATFEKIKNAIVAQ